MAWVHVLHLLFVIRLNINMHNLYLCKMWEHVVHMMLCEACVSCLTSNICPLILLKEGSTWNIIQKIKQFCAPNAWNRVTVHLGLIWKAAFFFSLVVARVVTLIGVPFTAVDSNPTIGVDFIHVRNISNGLQKVSASTHLCLKYWSTVFLSNTVITSFFVPHLGDI